MHDIFNYTFSILATYKKTTLTFICLSVATTFYLTRGVKNNKSKKIDVIDLPGTKKEISLPEKEKKKLTNVTTVEEEEEEGEIIEVRQRGYLNWLYIKNEALRKLNKIGEHYDSKEAYLNAFENICGYANEAMQKDSGKGMDYTKFPGLGKKVAKLFDNCKRTLKIKNDDEKVGYLIIDFFNIFFTKLCMNKLSGSISLYFLVNVFLRTISEDSPGECRTIYSMCFPTFKNILHLENRRIYKANFKNRWDFINKFSRKTNNWDSYLRSGIHENVEWYPLNLLESIDKEPLAFFDTALVFLYIALCDLDDGISIKSVGDLNKENKGFCNMIKYLQALNRMVIIDQNCNLPELIKTINQQN